MQAARAYFRKPGTKSVKSIENHEIREFIRWANKNFPYVVIYCDAMGEALTDAARMRIAATRNITVPDIIIDYPSRGYNGARFEHKAFNAILYMKDGTTLRKQPYTRRFKNGSIKKGDHLQDQAEGLAKLKEAGYYSRFTKGLPQLKEQFLWYIDPPILFPVDDDVF